MATNEWVDGEEAERDAVCERRFGGVDFPTCAFVMG